MKVLSVKQLAEADSITVKKQKITSEILMERAATALFNSLHSKLSTTEIPIKIFCGIGNNGGDGLVIGRLLHQEGYKVTIYVVNYSHKRSENFLSNYDKIKEITHEWPILLTKDDDFPELSSNDFVIDAMFGIGLNRPLEGWVSRLVKHINKSHSFVLAVDMPSGLFADKIPNKKEAVIKADFTITFQTPKLVFFLPQTSKYVGDLQIIDIGLDREYLEKATANIQLVEKSDIQKLYKNREKESHKGNYGHSLIIGGSYGKIGSVGLSSTAALHSGAGMVTIFAPKCGYEILQTLLPEAMVITDKAEKTLTNIEFELDPDVVCFGMGVGTSAESMEAMEKLLKKTSKPMLIDADGLNILSKNKEFLNFVPPNSVLTPHPKELERLIGKWKDDFNKLKKVKAFTKKYKVTIVIKGAYTLVVKGEKISINSTGNPGMATAGSGDVLSGVITALISQNYDPFIAAIIGVFLHGKTGDIMAQKVSYEGLVSGDIAKNMGLSFLDLFKKEQETSQE